jgi:hypothetical protein
MKKLLTVVLFLIPVGVMAQTASANGSSSTSTTSAQGNNQAVTFATSNPSEITTNANINSTSTSKNTNHNIISGTSTNIVDYKGSYTVKNVPSVSGPPLITSNDTCMGSSSGGANGPGFGVSFGSTWTDEQCKRLKMSRELWNKGMKAASLAIDCMDAGARIALEMTGTKCPQSMTAEERRAAYGPHASVVGAAPSPAPNLRSASPLAINYAPAKMQAPNAPKATTIAAAASPIRKSEPAAPVMNPELKSDPAPVVQSIIGARAPHQPGDWQ